MYNQALVPGSNILCALSLLLAASPWTPQEYPALPAMASALHQNAACDAHAGLQIDFNCKLPSSSQQIHLSLLSPASRKLPDAGFKTISGLWLLQ